jgi:hypothetical protein
VVARIVSEATGNTSPEFQAKLKKLVAAEQSAAAAAATAAAAAAGASPPRSANERFLEGSVHGGRNGSTHGRASSPTGASAAEVKPGMSIFTPANT